MHRAESSMADTDSLLLPELPPIWKCTPLTTHSPKLPMMLPCPELTAGFRKDQKPKQESTG